MKSFAIILCCLGVLVSSAPRKVFYNIEDADSLFEDFVNKYNKKFTSEAEKQARFGIFKANLENINQKNELDANAVYGITEFTDLTDEEFVRTYTGLLPRGLAGELQCQRYGFNGTLGSAPDSFDWRQQSKVTSVKNQQSCGSCWTFSAAGTIEGQYAIKHNQLVDLSTKQILDCAKPSYGCDGGWMTNAILSMQEFGGIMAERDYPYQPVQGSCMADRNKIAAKVTGCRQFTFSSEEELKEILVQVGPLSIAAAASTWSHYNGGIMNMCDQTVNHAVLLVGYGTEGNQPYWIIKNSWSSSWGESGYIRLARNKNMCNIMQGMFVAAVVE